MRWLNNVPIVPLNYVQFRLAVPILEGTCKYTESGRSKIQSKLKLDLALLLHIMRNSNYERSIEFVDN